MQRLDASEINSLSMTNTDEIEEAKEKVDKRQEKIAQRKADLEANSYSYKAAKVIQKAFDQYFLDPILGFFMPGFGDILTSTLTLPFIYLALFEIKSIPLTLAIIYNALMDILKGLFPVIGDIFDAFNKSYTKSFRLINGFVDDDEIIKREVNKKAFRTLILSFILGVIIYFSYMAVMYVTESVGNLFNSCTQTSDVYSTYYSSNDNTTTLFENEDSPFEGVWELSSKNDTDEDGYATEQLLELRDNKTFTETMTMYSENTPFAQISIKGSYFLEDICARTVKDINVMEGKSLCQQYNIESIKFINYDCEEDEANAILNKWTEMYRKQNEDLASAKSQGKTFGLAYIQVNGDTMSWGDYNDPTSFAHRVK